MGTTNASTATWLLHPPSHLRLPHISRRRLRSRGREVELVVHGMHSMIDYRRLEQVVQSDVHVSCGTLSACAMRHASPALLCFPSPPAPLGFKVQPPAVGAEGQQLGFLKRSEHQAVLRFDSVRKIIELKGKETSEQAAGFPQTR